MAKRNAKQTSRRVARKASASCEMAAGKNSKSVAAVPYPRQAEAQVVLTGNAETALNWTACIAKFLIHLTNI